MHPRLRQGGEKDASLKQFAYIFFRGYNLVFYNGGRKPCPTLMEENIDREISKKRMCTKLDIRHDLSRRNWRRVDNGWHSKSQRRWYEGGRRRGKGEEEGYGSYQVYHSIDHAIREINVNENNRGQQGDTSSSLMSTKCAAATAGCVWWGRKMVVGFVCLLERQHGKPKFKELCFLSIGIEHFLRWR